MSDERRRRSAADGAISRAAEVLRPWMKERLVTWPPDRDGRVDPHDPLYLVRILLDRWRIEFSHDLGADCYQAVHDLRTFRNQWAHFVPLDDESLRRGLLACRKLVDAVGSRIQEPPAFAVGEVMFDDAPRPGVASPSRQHRRMRNPAFREQQWEHRFDPHVEPINNLVDELIEEQPGRWMPYIPPYHGGTRSETLWLFQDPGKMTSTVFGGSGFLGCENDDPSAETAARCLDMAEVALDRVTPWNAYPWFQSDQGGVSAAMIDEGLDALVRLLSLMPDLHTVVAGGRKAQDSWERLCKRKPEFVQPYRYVKSLHTSGRGVTWGGKHSKAAGMARIEQDLRRAAADHP